MSKKLLVPKIRFEEFKNLEPWNKKKLGEMVVFFTGLTYSPTNIVEEKDTLVLRSSNVKNGEIVDADNVYVDSKIVNSDNVRVGDIIVVVRNGSRHLIGKNAQVKKRMENTVIGAFMTGIRSDMPEFINALLDTNKFQYEIHKDLGATINQITTGNFKKMKFNFPEKEEASKIGYFFKKIDNLIYLQRKKINKVKDIKSSYLSEMFPKNGEKYPKKRFEGFSGEWESVSLKSILNITTGSLDANEATPFGKYPFFTTSEKPLKIDKYDFTGPAITLAGNGVMGNSRYIPSGVKFNAYQRVYVLTQTENDNHYPFLNLSISKYLPVEVNRRASGSVISYITKDVLEGLTIKLPSLYEQKKIAELFKNINSQISIEEEKLAKLEKLKQAYLKDMFV